MKKDSYEARLNEYLEANLHPETARNIGRIVATSHLMSAEGAMSIILQMQLDHARVDADLADQPSETNIIERPASAQLYRYDQY